MHLTLGIDTHIWGLTYAGLRSVALRRAGLVDTIPLSTKLPERVYWSLQVREGGCGGWGSSTSL